MDLEESDYPDPNHLQKLIISDFKEPVIFKNLINDWELLKWDLKKWSELLGSKKLQFRCGKATVSHVPQWENSCSIQHLSMEEFVKITKENKEGKEWWYFDYKYMNQWLSDKPEVVTKINWERFGFPHKSGEDSTLWIGSKGAHTPCHFDTYGCNLVAQIFGKKLWYLFPPNSSRYLLPTRIPYEESSVYSDVNLYCGNPLPEEMSSSIHVVTLNPGDVLFVPKHWWHYVENLTTAISVNTWISMPSDSEDHLNESLVQFFISQLSKDLSLESRKWMLTSMEEDPGNLELEKAMKQIETSLLLCQKGEKEQNKGKICSVEDDEQKIVTQKKEENVKKFIADLPQYSATEFQKLLLEKRRDFEVTFGDFACDKQNELCQFGDLTSDDNFVKSVVNAFCNPETILCVAQNLLK